MSSGLYLAAILGAFWSLSSLAVSHWVYDRSHLSRWVWLRDVLAPPPRRWVCIHAGLDEATEPVQRLFPGSSGRSISIFDESIMHEPSIRRLNRAAQRRGGASCFEWASHRSLPIADGSLEAALLPFSAHELRHVGDRAALLSELRRCLAPGGRMVLVEHLRDAANFLAFGPGAWHFLPRRAWQSSIEAAGLVCEQEFRVTPFVRVFVLKRQRTSVGA